MPYLAQRAMTVAGVKYGPGDAIPGQALGRRQMTAAINMGRIVYTPEQTDVQYVARRPLLVNGVQVLPGARIPAETLTPHQLEAAVATKQILAQAIPTPVPTAPVPEVKRRGRPPRRIQAGQPVGRA